MITSPISRFCGIVTEIEGIDGNEAGTYLIGPLDIDLFRVVKGELADHGHTDTGQLPKSLIRTLLGLFYGDQSRWKRNLDIEGHILSQDDFEFLGLALASILVLLV